MDDEDYVLEEDDEYTLEEAAEGSGDETMELEGEDERDDAGLDAVFGAAPATPRREDAECWSPRTRLGKQRQMIDEVVDVLAVSEAAARVMLREFRWNADRLKERYFENAARVVEFSGATPSGAPPVRYPQDGQRVSCGICFSEFTGRAAVATGACDHFFCISCYGTFMAHELSEKGVGSLGMHCPAVGCRVVCDRALVATVLGVAALPPPFDGKNAALLTRYDEFQERSFVDDSPSVQWCPQQRCGLCVHAPAVTAASLAAAKASKTQPPMVVTCRCRHSFCFMCLHEAHTPAQCHMVRQWLNKEQEDKNTGNWILANTKPCPGCGTPIEKNEGCNNITCRSCGFSFCWVCEKEWSQHGTSWYQCNFYDANAEEEDLKRDTARQDLARYIHYYTRYANHDNSKYLEQRILTQTEAVMAEMQESSEGNLDTVEYLWEAALQLIRARETLKYTYVYAYYLEGGAQKSLFEYNQAQLEHNTELLSKMLEPKNQRASERAAVINQQVLVRQSLERLQQGVFDAKSMAGML